MKQATPPSPTAREREGEGSPPAAGQFNRPELQRVYLLLGEEVTAALEKTRVIVVGLGGVGSWAAEALARSGIGHITLIDNDSVCPSNINRQIQALPSTVGLPKAAALMKRLLEINPRCDIAAFNQIFSLETAPLFGIEKADYVIDAIDSLPHKLDLIQYAERPTLFSSMGMAQKLDPTRIKTADIWNTRGCSLARLVRQGLRKRCFAGHFTTVFSDEQLPRHEAVSYESGESGKKIINGSIVTVTAAAGMTLASLVINDVCHTMTDHFSGEGF
ncbi:MAG: tRNA threonylcarbamoyladenosine dehydratase [Treponema sp.]|nr:tRNA threonylcarbamoyladenosine dehydratase [Treponema sp.]